MKKYNLKTYQDLPRNWEARERLRNKGQFWTPNWVARAMVAYAVGNNTDHIFDPAVGTGALFRAAKEIACRLRRPLALLGTEMDPHVLQQASDSGLCTGEFSGVEIRDFVLDPPTRQFAAIVANPPYIRHHRLERDVKERLRLFGAALIGRPIDGRAGYHVYFLLRALTLLADGGRLAFIIPSDTCEGVFASILWRWITSRYRLDAIVTFSPEATPFPGVDTNPLVCMLSRTKPDNWFYWVRCNMPESSGLTEWCLSGFKITPDAGLQVWRRSLDEALHTGLSRPPHEHQTSELRLLDFAHVTRGIATGANDFFLLTKSQVAKLEIPQHYLRRAIARTRDIRGNLLTLEDLDRLEATERPTYLLSIGNEPTSALAPKLQAYLRTGEELGLHRRPLIATRTPWYRMEVRQAPPILFAYLGRRNSRFILNLAGVVPLTGFLCVYPHWNNDAFIQRLWRVLSDPRTTANLVLVGKSYGEGAVKVEPRALERLLLPKDAIEEAGLCLPDSPVEIQMTFPFPD